MFKNIVFIACIFFCGNLFAQSETFPLDWVSIEVAELNNKKEPKKFLIDVYADWCYWCKKIETELASDSILANYLNTNFHLVKLNPEDQTDITFKNKTYKRKSFSYTYSDKTRKVNELVVELINQDFIYPSLIFLDEKLDNISIVEAYKTKEELEKFIKFIGTNAYQSKKWSVFSKEYSK